MNDFVIVLACTKSSKLISLEENIISVQQLPLCLLWFFVFSSQVLNSGIKSCFDRVVFQVAICEECFCIRLWCHHLQFLLLFFWFIEVLSLKLFYKLIFTLYLHELIAQRFDTGILHGSCAVILLKTLSRLPHILVFPCLILPLMAACKNIPFHAFVTMIC